MMLKPKHCLAIIIISVLPELAVAGAVDDLLQRYATEASQPFDANLGQEFWNKDFVDNKAGQKRQCSTCHTKNLSTIGKHKKTGKKIDPMSPSINSERLTDIKKIEKWFKRNCKWTIGRRCTPQEKGHLLLFISQQ